MGDYVRGGCEDVGGYSTPFNCYGYEVYSRNGKMDSRRSVGVFFNGSEYSLPTDTSFLFAVDVRYYGIGLLSHEWDVLLKKIKLSFPSAPVGYFVRDGWLVSSERDAYHARQEKAKLDGNKFAKKYFNTPRLDEAWQMNMYAVYLALDCNDALFNKRVGVKNYWDNRCLVTEVKAIAEMSELGKVGQNTTAAILAIANELDCTIAEAVYLYQYKSHYQIGRSYAQIVGYIGENKKLEQIAKAAIELKCSFGEAAYCLGE